MRHRVLLVVLALVLGMGLTACAPQQQQPGPETPAETPDEAPPSAGIRLAPGLHEMEDGRVQAIGTLVRRDLEGGFWAIEDSSGASQSEGDNVAVIANGDDVNDQLEPLEGRMVSVTGTRFDGASIRMAGPEIVMESIEEIDDTPGIAE